MHDHAIPKSCEHELKFCATCDEVFCEKCNGVWTKKIPSFSWSPNVPLPSFPSYPIRLYEDPQTVPLYTVNCSHAC